MKDDAEMSAPMLGSLFDGLLKQCCECGNEKPESKFYRDKRKPDGLMERCKACHNGCTEWIRRQHEFYAEPQLGDPREDQIRAACERFQAKWTTKQRERRRLAAVAMKTIGKA